MRSEKSIRTKIETVKEYIRKYEKNLADILTGRGATRIGKEKADYIYLALSKIERHKGQLEGLYFSLREK